MYTLGYSGFDNAINFRKKMLEGLSDQEYRMCQGLDSAACLTLNGTVIAAAEEERFNGEKFTSQFPINAINFCLKQANISIDDIDFVCHGFNYADYAPFFQLDNYNKQLYTNVLSPESQLKLIRNIWPNFPVHKFIGVPHHLAHAASTFYPSDFDEALIFIADGIGEVDSISFFHGKNHKIFPLKSYNFFSSLGVLYSIFTIHLGFSVNSDEYKVMGLAPYGDPSRYRSFFDELIELQNHGGVFIKSFNLNKTPIEKQTFRGFRNWISEKLIPPLQPNEEIRQEHKDLAASLQECLVKALFHILNYWRNKTGLKNLCTAGGVSLNCSANGELLRSGMFDNIYIQPAASDSGTALGAALYQYHKMTESVLKPNPNKNLPLYGPEFSSDECLQVIKKYEDQISYEKCDEGKLLEDAASMIKEGKVIAWMQGRMEYGPRALGNRSILADPRHPEMRNIVNKLVKKRESFRPFAPSIKLESVHKYFDTEPGKELELMLFTVPVRTEYHQQLPAVTHVNGSARVQTVNKNQHPLYWKLLDVVEKKTGFPILLNTSFNVKGQPMVCSPDEAIKTLLNTNIDALFLGDYKITCRSNSVK